jgi:hypothetical protein
MKSILFVIAVVIAGFGCFYVLDSFRTKSMRALASKLGFKFIGRTLPASFTMTCYPFDGSLTYLWNVIEGQLNGVSVLVFDSAPFGTSRTFIAVQRGGEVFVSDGSFYQGKILQSNGWTAIYQWKPWVNLLGWSTSTKKIEDYLGQLATLKELQPASSKVRERG